MCTYICINNACVIYSDAMKMFILDGLHKQCVHDYFMAKEQLCIRTVFFCTLFYTLALFVVCRVYERSVWRNYFPLQVCSLKLSTESLVLSQ